MLDRRRLRARRRAIEVPRVIEPTDAGALRVIVKPRPVK